MSRHPVYLYSTEADLLQKVGKQNFKPPPKVESDGEFPEFPLGST
jgi:hypothetical protein